MKTKAGNKKDTKGFTLIELMVTVAVISIVLVAGTPGLIGLRNNMSVSSTADDLVNFFSYARGEAVARVVNVSVCVAADCNTSADWTDGRTAFIDVDGQCDLDAGDEILRQEPALSDRLLVVETTGAATCVTFNELGQNPSATERIFQVTTNPPSITESVTISTVGLVSKD